MTQILDAIFPPERALFTDASLTINTFFCDLVNFLSLSRVPFFSFQREFYAVDRSVDTAKGLYQTSLLLVYIERGANA